MTAPRSLKKWLAKHSSRSDSHRCAAGFNSGLYAGWNCSRMFAGACKQLSLATSCFLAG